MIEFLKNGDVVFAGVVIGHIDYEDGAFVGKNFKTEKRASSFDLDEVLRWFGIR